MGEGHLGGNRGRTVTRHRDVPAVRTADRRKPASPTALRPPSPTTDAGVLLQLQALAGNRAVGDLIEARGGGQRQGAAERQAPSRRNAPVIVAQRAESPHKSVADMTPGERLVKAISLSNIGQALIDKILSLVTPESLLIMAGTSLAVFAAAQFTPVGWAADLAIGLFAVFMVSGLITAIHHLVTWAEARNATTDEQIAVAADAFGKAIAEIGVDAVLLFLTKGISRGGQPPAASAAAADGNVALAFAGGGVRPVAIATIPKPLAAQLGLQAQPAAGTALNMAMTASGKPPGGKPEASLAGSGGSKQAPGLESGPPPKIQLGEIKPILSYVSGLYQLAFRAARGNDALATFDNEGNVHLQVFGDPKGTGTKSIIWEDNIGKVTPPAGVAPNTSRFGDLMEPLVRDLVSETIDQSFAAKRANAPGPDLVPTRGGR